MNIIQVYAPTASHDYATVEAFYNILANTLEICKSKLTYIIGDFNAKVGMKDQNEKVGLGERNHRGQALVDFAARYNLRIKNTFFTKPKSRKWT